MPTATRRDHARRSRHEARERIVAAVTSLLRERSYSDLGVDEVMREAGLSRTIFYRHFDDLGELILRVTRPAIAELYETQPRLEEIGPGDEAAAIRVGLEPAVTVYGRHGPLLRAMAEAEADDEALARDRAEIRRRFSDQAETYLRLAQSRGATPISDVAETAHALTVMSEGYLLDCFGHGERCRPEVALRTLSEIWLAMVRS